MFFSGLLLAYYVMVWVFVFTYFLFYFVCISSCVLFWLSTSCLCLFPTLVLFTPVFHLLLICVFVYLSLCFPLILCQYACFCFPMCLLGSLFCSCVPGPVFTLCLTCIRCLCPCVILVCTFSTFSLRLLLFCCQPLLSNYFIFFPTFGFMDCSSLFVFPPSLPPLCLLLGPNLSLPNLNILYFFF